MPIGNSRESARNRARQIERPDRIRLEGRETLSVRRQLDAEVSFRRADCFEHATVTTHPRELAEGIGWRQKCDHARGRRGHDLAPEGLRNANSPDRNGFAIEPAAWQRDTLSEQASRRLRHDEHDAIVHILGTGHTRKEVDRTLRGIDRDQPRAGLGGRAVCRKIHKVPARQTLREPVACLVVSELRESRGHAAGRAHPHQG